MQCHCITFLLTLQKNMKVFSSILVLYMMVLVITPCADTFEKQTVRFQEFSTEITHQHSYESHDPKETKDLCTPFCICICCGRVSGIVLQWNVYNLVKAETFELSKPEIYYLAIFIPRYFGEIWQPPKINA